MFENISEETTIEKSRRDNKLEFLLSLYIDHTPFNYPKILDSQIPWRLALACRNN